ncbi:mucin-2 isoform X7 [Manacus candei]|uniref:mucin-2 isoform X7 n=1 Tax=Manacus candei TaxID=415023 RepID=UPI002226FD86|nr:mucin-2 isoform X7 [Manacus candei]
MGLRVASLLFILWLALSYASEIRKGRTRNHGHYVCSTWGNDHFKTFDGDIYQFPGVCEYNFVSDCSDSYAEFSVHIQRALNSDNHPEIQYILLKIKDVTVYLKPKLVVVDGRIVKTPYYSSGLLIESSDIYTKIYAKLGMVLMWNQQDALMVELDNKFNNLTCGLCGDYNGIPIYNEFIKGDASYNSITYGNLQKISKPNAKCEDPDETQALPSCNEHRDECERLLTSSAFADCRFRLNLEMYIQACMQDKCACNGTEDSFCICSTISEYSRQCSHAGGRPGEWRTQNFCPKTCPDTMVYRESSSPCMDTCSHLDISSLCEEHYMDGCFCPEGTVYDDITGKGCVPVSQCYCKLLGKQYAPGENISNECEECTCNSGRWTCKDLPCPGTCSVEGGSHIRTFDGKKYTFHGDCYYVLAKDTANDSYALLADLAPCGSTDRQTCLKTVVLLVDNKKNVVVFRSDGSVLLNEMTVNVPHVSASFSIFQPSSNYLVVQTPFELQVQIQLVPVMQLFVTVDQSAEGKIQGLCGNFNGMEGDDFKTTSGLVEATGSAFANTWKAQSICTDQAEKLEDPCSLSIESANYAEHWCSLLKNPEGPFATCHLVIDPSEYYKKCKYDTCLCEDNEECLCATLSSYSRACAFKGIILEGWRDSVCSSEVSACQGNQVFLYNITRCQQTCRSLADGEKYCLQDFAPVDGCGCPSDTYLDTQDNCVPVSECPCYYKGSYLEPGEYFTKDGDRCVCRNAKVQCTSVRIRMKSVEECSSNKTFFDCDASSKWTSQTPVQLSCHTSQTNHFQAECVSGCVCPEGLYDDGRGGCVEEEDCPCIHNNEWYSSGQKITVDCNTCTCQKGVWSCTANECYGTCMIYGSGHYITFDGKFYDFDGNCEYVAIQDFCGDKNSSGSFSIITENVPCGTTGVTCSKAIKMFLGKTELKLENKEYKEIQRDVGDDVLYWNRTVGLYLVIEASNGVMLIWDKKTTVFIKLSPNYKGKVCGLCGNFDDKSNNDFITRNGLQETNALKFGNSWKQSPMCPDVTEEIKPCDLKPHRKSWAEKECSIILSEVFKICHSKVDPVPFYDACVHDACSCDSGGDCECFCSAVAAYAQECTKVEACVFWRTPDICPIFCDYYNPRDECEWHYEPCGSNITTCRMINNVSTNFTVPYLEGCYPRCPKDKPIYNEETNECVPEDQCWCYIDGIQVPPGHEIPTEENCTICVCGPSGSIQCKPVPGCPCVINGTSYQVGQTVAQVQDGDICITYICAENGSVVPDKIYPCPTSSSPTVLSTSFPTSTLTTTVTTTSHPVTTTPCFGLICDWTEWFDVSNPEEDGGDYETYDEIRKHGYKICEAPEKIECRAEDKPDVSLEELGQKVQCDVSYGLICKNEEQDVTMWQLCYNYEIRVNCCEWQEIPCEITPTPSTPQTATSTTTKTTVPLTTTSRIPTEITTSPTHIASTTSELIPSVSTPVTSTSPGPGSSTPSTASPSTKSTTTPTARPEETSTSTASTTVPPISTTSSSTPGTFSNFPGSPTPTPTTSSTSTPTPTFTTTVPPPGPGSSTPSTASPSTKSTATPTARPGETSTSTTSTTVPPISTTSSSTPGTTTTVPGLPTSSPTPEGCECIWTDWIDVSYPDSSDRNGGDYETLENIHKVNPSWVCAKVENISCRAEKFPNIPIADLGQIVECSVNTGLVCNNRDQHIGGIIPQPVCLNYEISVCCTPDRPECLPPHTPSTTTSTTSSVISSTISTTASTSVPTETPSTISSTTVPPSSTTSSSTPGTPPISTTSSTSTPTPTFTTTLPPPGPGSSTPSTASPSTKSTTTPTARPEETSTSTASTTVPPISTTSSSTPGTTTTVPGLPTSSPTPEGPGSSTPSTAFPSTKSTTTPTARPGETSISTASTTVPPISTSSSSTPRTTTVPGSSTTPISTTSSTSVPTPPSTTTLPTPGPGSSTPSTASPSTKSTTTPTARPGETSISTASTTVPPIRTTSSSTPRTTTVPGSSTTPISTTSSTSTPTPTYTTTVPPPGPGSSTPSTASPSTKSTTTPTARPEETSISTASTTVPPISTTSSSTPGTTTTVPGLPTSSPTPEGCECIWTDWIDVSYPDSSDRNGGDYETLENIHKVNPSWVCAKVENISCRAEKFPNIPIADLGQIVECSVNTGLVCNNRDQHIGGIIPQPVCLNYEISVCCTPDRPECLPPHTPSTTTSTTSSVISSTISTTASTSVPTETPSTISSTTVPPSSTTSSSTPGTPPISTTSSTSTPTPTFTTTLPPPGPGSSTPSTASPSTKSTTTPTARPGETSISTASTTVPPISTTSSSTPGTFSNFPGSPTPTPTTSSTSTPTPTFTTTVPPPGPGSSTPSTASPSTKSTTTPTARPEETSTSTASTTVPPISTTSSSTPGTTTTVPGLPTSSPTPEGPGSSTPSTAFPSTKSTTTPTARPGETSISTASTTVPPISTTSSSTPRTTTVPGSSTTPISTTSSTSVPTPPSTTTLPTPGPGSSTPSTASPSTKSTTTPTARPEETSTSTASTTVPPISTTSSSTPGTFSTVTGSPTPTPTTSSTSTPTPTFTTTVPPPGPGSSTPSTASPSTKSTTTPTARPGETSTSTASTTVPPISTTSSSTPGTPPISTTSSTSTPTPTYTTTVPPPGPGSSTPSTASPSTKSTTTPTARPGETSISTASTTVPPISTTSSSTPGTFSNFPGSPTPTPTTSSTSTPTPTFTTTVPPPGPGSSTPSTASPSTKSTATPTARPEETSTSTARTTVPPISTTSSSTPGTTTTVPGLPTSSPTPEGPGSSTPSTAFPSTKSTTTPTARPGETSISTASTTVPPISTTSSSTPLTTTVPGSSTTPISTTSSTSVPTPPSTTTLPTPGPGSSTPSTASPSTKSTTTPTARPGETSTSTASTTVPPISTTSSSTPGTPPISTTSSTSTPTPTYTTTVPPPGPGSSTPSTASPSTKSTTTPTAGPGETSTSTASTTVPPISTTSSSTPGTTTTVPGLPTSSPTPEGPGSSTPSTAFPSTKSTTTPTARPGETSISTASTTVPPISTTSSSTPLTTTVPGSSTTPISTTSSTSVPTPPSTTTLPTPGPGSSTPSTASPSTKSTTTPTARPEETSISTASTTVPPISTTSSSTPGTFSTVTGSPTPTPTTSSTSTPTPTFTTTVPPPGPGSSTPSTASPSTKSTITPTARPGETSTSTASTTVPPISTTSSSTPRTTTVPGSSTTTSPPISIVTRTPQPPTTLPLEGTTPGPETPTKTSTPVTPSATPLPTTRTTERGSTVFTRSTTIQQSTSSVSTSPVTVTTSEVTETGSTPKTTPSGPTPSRSTSTTPVTETPSHETTTTRTVSPPTGSHTAPVSTTTSGPSSLGSTPSSTVSLSSASTSSVPVTTSGTTPTKTFTTTSGTTSSSFTISTATTTSTTLETLSPGSTSTSGPTATSTAVTTTGSSTYSTVTPVSGSSSTTGLTPTTPKKICSILPDESYEQGESWWLCNCTKAICIEDNIVQVIPIICNPPPKPTCANGLSPVPVIDEDGCCWHWECDCYCTGWGDPHYMTFDGLYYSYQGNCTYVLVEEINKKVDNFGVYIDNYHCDSRDVVSCPRTLIVRHETQEVRIATVKPNTVEVEVTVNNQLVALPYKKFGVSIYESGINRVVEIPELKMNVTYNGLSFSIRMPYSLFGNNTQGQCGTCNNNTADDCMLPNGNIAENCETMADHWQVVDPSKPQCSPGLNPTSSPSTTPAEPCKESSICELLLGSVFKPCHEFVRPEKYYAACVFDSCVLPNLDLECSSLQIYAATCADQGACIDWRSHTNGVCSHECPSGKEFRACGPIKEPTCKSSHQNETSTKQVEGCFCPNGTMLYDSGVDVCVKTCGCVGVDMIPREFGEKFIVDCQDCTCLEGEYGIVCQPHECPEQHVTCNGEGFYQVTEVNPEDSCCPLVTCKCNTSLCTAKAPKCTLGFELHSYIPSGQCCPVYQCVPKGVCVHESAEFLPNSSVFVDKCQNCFCTNEVNVSTQLNIISCEPLPCNTYCAPGYELQPVKGECCGKCVQTKCIIHANNEELILSPGDFKNDPNNNCTIYSCVEIHNQLISSTSEITCPAFNEDSCKPGTISFLPNGCCKTCAPLDSSTPCSVREREDFIVYNGCRSVDRVVMTECEGTCGTVSLYSAEANSMDHSCSCCRESQTTEKYVVLKCPGGQSLSHKYIYVESCSCQDTECQIPQSSELQRRK